MNREFGSGIAVALLLGVMAGPLGAQNSAIVSLDSGGLPADCGGAGRMSADGRWLVFATQDSDIVPGDTNGVSDIFLRDMQTGVTTRVSLTAAGGQTTFGGFLPDVNDDGTVVTWVVDGTDFAPGGSPFILSVVARNVLTGVTTLVSADSAGGQGNADAGSPRISGDGRWIGFYSEATDIVPGVPSDTSEAYLRDMLTGTTELISTDSLGQAATIGSGPARASEDGRFVCFVGFGPNIVPGDTNGKADVFVRDRLLGTTQLVSVDSLGGQGNANSDLADISADGTVVAFRSAAGNLAAGDTNGVSDVFVHELSTGVTSRVSVDSSGTQGNGPVYLVEVSGDGQHVAFQGDASNLVPGDTNGNTDVFEHDLATGITQRASVRTDGSQFGNFVDEPALSGDGRFVTFLAESGPPGSKYTTWRRDTLVPIASAGPGLAGTHGVPSLTAVGIILAGTDFTLTLSGALESTPTTLFVGLSAINAPFKGGVMVPAPDFTLAFTTDATGGVTFSALWPAGFPSGPILYLQFWMVDPAGPQGFAASNAITITVP